MATADQEEPFVGRTAQVGDDLGSRVLAARLCRDLMRLCFLLERRYAPYAKWLGSAFASLDAFAEIAPALSRALEATEHAARERALVDAFEAAARRHNALGLTDPQEPSVRRFYDRPFRVLGSGRFVDACLDRVSEPLASLAPADRKRRSVRGLDRRAVLQRGRPPGLGSGPTARIGLPPMEIRPAEPDDWPSVRDVRLRALQDAPDAFGATFGDETDNDEDRWRSWMTGWDGAVDQALFAAVESEEWLGIALGVRWGAEPDTTHLYAMWVDPAHRRRGAGRALVQAVVKWARALPDVRRIVLTATVSNPVAIALYERCGFADTGERTPLREGSEILTMLMARSV